MKLNFIWQNKIRIRLDFSKIQNPFIQNPSKRFSSNVMPSFQTILIFLSRFMSSTFFFSDCRRGDMKKTSNQSFPVTISRILLFPLPHPHNFPFRESPWETSQVPTHVIICLLEKHIENSK